MRRETWLLFIIVAFVLYGCSQALADLDKYISAGLVALGSWETEADYVFSFFEQRVEWIDSWLK